MALLLGMVGATQSWNVSLAILNLCLISAVMSLGAEYSVGLRRFVQCWSDGLNSLRRTG